MSDKKIKYQVSAEDNFSSTFEKFKSEVMGAGNAFESFKRSALAIGTGLGLTGFAAFIKSSIDAADQMGKMAQKAGIATDEMSKLAYAAKIGDVSNETLSISLKKLNQNLVEAGNSSSKSAQLFKLMGVDIKQGASPALEKISDAFAQIPDGSAKAAAAVELFGRSGTDMIPFLNEGAEGIRKLKDEAVRLGAVISDETALAADQFNDNLARLGVVSGNLGRTIGADLAPKLAQISEAMLEAYRDAGLLRAVWVGLGGVGALAFTDELNTTADNIRKLTRQIKESIAELEAVKGSARGAVMSGLGDGTGMAEWLQGNDGVKVRANQLIDLHNKLAQLQDEQRKKLQQLKDAQSQADQARNLALENQINKALSLNKVNDDAVKQAERLKSILDKINAKDSGVDQSYFDDLKVLYADFEKRIKGLSHSSVEYLEILSQYQSRVEKLTKQQKFYTDAQQEAIKADLDGWEAMKKLKYKYDESIDSVKKMVVDMEEELRTLGLTNTQREISIKLHEMENKGIKAGSKEYEDLVPRIQKVVEEKEAFLAQQALWNDVADFGSKAFTTLLTSGRGAFQELGNMLKNFAKDMIALFARRWILNMMAGGSIMDSAGSALIGQGIGAAAGNSAFSGGGMASSALGTVGGWFGMGGGASTGFVAGQGATVAGSATGLGSMAGGGGGMLAAGGWIAAIVAAVVANMNLFKSGWNSNSSGAYDGRSYASMSATPLIGMSAIGTVVANKILTSIGLSDRAASIISGSSITNAIYGFRTRQNDAAGITGTVGWNGIDGKQWQDYSQRGGLFRGDKRGTDYSALDPALKTEFDSHLDGFKNILRRIGKTIGVNADEVLAGFKQEFNLQLTSSDGPEAIKATVDKFFKGIFQGEASLLFAGYSDNIKSKIDAFAGTSDELIKFITDIAGAIEGITSARKNIDAFIASLSGDMAPTIKLQLDAMRGAVDDARSALDSLKGSDDLVKINEAQQVLQQAVISRYQSEMQMIRDLQNGIEQIRDTAYQMQMNLASKIVSLGGSRDIAGIALNRADQLRAGIGGNQNYDQQAANLGKYVGAIDSWYQARYDEIQRRIQSEQAANAAIGQAMAAAAQTRIEQLNKELALSQAMLGVADNAQKMMESMQLSLSNPMALSGRVGIASDGVESLRAAWQNAKGDDKASAASKYLEALQTRSSMQQELFQRPSKEWEDAYNQTMREMAEVRDDAKTLGEQAFDLQKRIVDLQSQANAYQQMTATASSASYGALEQLRQEALERYQYAETEATRIYGEQERQHQESLRAITGGVDVGIYAISLQKNTVDELKEIKNVLRETLNKVVNTENQNAGNTSITIPVSIGGKKVDEIVIDSVIRNPQAVARAVQYSM